MSKRPSLTYQVTSVLGGAFDQGFGRSRHADKRNAINNKKTIDTYTKDKIYSRNTYNSTRTTCVSFTNFCKENYGVRYLEEIKAEMFAKYIKRGSTQGKSYEQNTAETYYSRIKKLENAFKTKTRKNVIFADKTYVKYVSENVQVKEKMPRKIHDQIIKKAYHNKKENGLAFDTSRNLGLRASEISNLRKKDFKFKDGSLKKIYIDKSKGGRCRYISEERLTEKQKQTVIKVYDYFKDKLNDHDRLFINKAASYETTFSRIRDKLTDEKYKGCGIHSMRKEFAQDYFNREIERRINNMTTDIMKKEIEREIKKELTEMLGHNRIEVLKSYLE